VRDKKGQPVTGVSVRGGKFIVQYTDSTGRVRFKTTSASNLTEAKAAREKLRVDARSGDAVVPATATVRDVAEDFLSTFGSLVEAGEKSQRTLDLYEQRWSTHLEPKLGRLRIQSVRPDHVARLLDDLRRAGLAPWTVKGVYVLLGSIFSHAMTRGLIAESPLKRLSRAERPTGKAKTKPRTLTDEECGKLIASASGLWRVMLSVAVGTGLRLSELIALQWQNVSFEDAEIRVTHQLSVATKTKPARLVPLKTGAAERDVYLVSELVELLKKHKARVFQKSHAKPEDFIFCTRDGKPLSQRNASGAIRKAGDAAGLNVEGLEPLSCHDLRYTAISRLIAAGLDVVQVQRQAGHSRPSITLDIYSKEFERAKRSEDVRAKIAATGIGAALAMK
jgi:integrase